jgi:hypothetical protein
MGLAGMYSVAGNWPAWTSAAGFSTCDVVGDRELPKAFLLARADDRPTAGFAARRADDEIHRHRAAQLAVWREFWRRPVARRSEVLIELLRGQLAKLVRGATPAEIDVKRPIFELGVDSLLVSEWQDQLDPTLFGLSVPGLITPNRSVESLADELASLFSERF